MRRQHLAEERTVARRALALSSLKLSDHLAAMDLKGLKPLLSAWASRARQKRRVRRTAAKSLALLAPTLPLAFRAWKELKMSGYQAVKAEFLKRDREFQQLLEISQAFFGLSQENVQRLKHMEAALQAADRALQPLGLVVWRDLGPRIGAARGDALELEIKRLREALTGHAEGAGARGAKLQEEVERQRRRLRA